MLIFSNLGRFVQTAVLFGKILTDCNVEILLFALRSADTIT